MKGINSIAAAAALTAFVVVGVRAQDRPITLDSSQGNLEQLTGENDNPLLVSGFGVGSYSFDRNSRENTFGAGKVAVSLFREIGSHVWAFGQLTTALEVDDVTGEPVTETEIDNLLINIVPPGAVNLSLSFGKFDAPIGTERDDEPLNFLASGSYNAQLSRPVKAVGLLGRWNVDPKFDITAYITNGWDADISPTHRKSGGVRLGILPSTGLSFGVSGLVGAEGDPADPHTRALLNLDYTYQPVRDWIFSGEANLGRESDAVAPGQAARWRGASLTVFRRLGQHFGLAGRGDLFNDRDGFRSGTTQKLTSLSLSPSYFLGVGRQGIFANVERTSFRIPRFQVRAEARLNHSSELAFANDNGPTHWQLQYLFQLVALF